MLYKVNNRYLYKTQICVSDGHWVIDKSHLDMIC